MSTTNTLRVPRREGDVRKVFQPCPKSERVEDGVEDGDEEEDVGDGEGEDEDEEGEEEKEKEEEEEEDSILAAVPVVVCGRRLFAPRWRRSLPASLWLSPPALHVVLCCRPSFP